MVECCVGWIMAVMMRPAEVVARSCWSTVSLDGGGMAWCDDLGVVG